MSHKRITLGVSTLREDKSLSKSHRRGTVRCGAGHLLLVYAIYGSGTIIRQESSGSRYGRLRYNRGKSK